MQRHYDQRQLGFSLLELLVVVAIIGTLAAAGMIGYQSYADNARESVVTAAQSDWSRRIPSDQFGAEGDTFFEGNALLETGEFCVQYVDRLVHEANQQNTNPYYPDDDEPYFNGHRAAVGHANGAFGWASPGDDLYRYTSNQSPPFRPDWMTATAASAIEGLSSLTHIASGVLAIPPGKTVVFCRNGKWEVSQGNTISICSCVTAEGCNLMHGGDQTPPTDDYCGPMPVLIASSGIYAVPSDLLP